MRTNVNLASQQYQDARAFYMRWTTILGLILAITLILAGKTWRTHKHAVEDTRDIRTAEDRIAHLNEQRRRAEEILNRAENQDVRDQSQFWNDVFDQKSFSWTQLFSDLEKIMPPRAAIVNAEPALTPDKRLQLKMIFVGEKYDDASELLSRMEHSERFHMPVLTAEGPYRMGTGAGSTLVVQFEIMTFYSLAVPAEQPKAAKGKKGA